MNNDPIIEAARRDLEALDAQRQEIEGFLARYQRYRASAPVIAPSPAPQIPARSARADEVLSAVADILALKKDAMPLGDIFDALLARNIAIGGRNPKQNLSQKLSSHGELKSYGKIGWYFADTVPPGLDGRSRLASHLDEIEEGPATGMARPFN